MNIIIDLLLKNKKLQTLMQDFILSFAPIILKQLINSDMTKIEHGVDSFFNNLKLKMAKALIDEYEEALYKTRSKHLRVKSKEAKCLTTLFGDITYIRRRYEYKDKSKGKGYVYLLDEHLGLVKWCRFTPCCIHFLTKLKIKYRLSTRSTTEAFFERTGVFISPPTVMNIVKRSASILIHNEQKEQIALHSYKSPCSNTSNKEQIETLFVEADGIYIPAQSQKRDGTYSAKHKKHEVSVVKFYESKKNGKCQNVKYVTGVSLGERLNDHIYMFMASNGLNSVKNIFLGTDGEQKYKDIKDVMPKHTIHILDPWHLNRSIRAIGNRELSFKISHLIKNKQIDECLELIKQNIESCSNPKKELKDLRLYIENNKQLILNIDKSKSLGTIEGTNSNLISRGIKHIGGGWSKESATAIVVLTNHFANTGELPYYTSKPKDLALELETLLNKKPMSVEKALKLGQGKEYIKTGVLTGRRKATNNFIRRKTNPIVIKSKQQ